MWSPAPIPSSCTLCMMVSCLACWCWGGGEALPPTTALPRHWSCLACWCWGGGGGWWMTPPLSTPSPAPLGLGDRHLPGLLVLGGGGLVDDSTPIYTLSRATGTAWLHVPGLLAWGAGGWSTPPHLLFYPSPLNWQESLSLSSLCVTGKPQLRGEWGSSLVQRAQAINMGFFQS